ncbi:MAG: tetratricopeptide repeat protein [Candidatus Sericytochromatia bacterium]|nr:tetratricopeptide repeat protein [Candidatus Tanganyikabacteria bacterium]
MIQQEQQATPALELAQFVARTYGRVFDAELAERLLERVVRDGEDERAVVHRLGDAPEDSPERRALTELVTVGETYFFRERTQFDVLESEILPALAARVGDRPLRVWCAGSSTGEEAYSVAIVALRVLGAQARKRLQIVGSDLNPSYVERARKGVFLRRSFRGVGPEQLADHLVEAEGGFRVTDLVRDMVEFRVHNLMNGGSYLDFLGGAVDLVLCRNVCFYFDKEAFRAVNRKLAEVVAPGGYLLLGAAETVLHDSGALRLEKHGATFLYHKPEGAPAGLPPDMPVPPAVRRAEFRRATGILGQPAQRPFHGGTGPLTPLPFRADVEEELPPEEGRLGQALILIDMGDYAGASVLCHSALEEDPFRPAAHFLLGLARRLQGSFQEAVHQFRAAAYLQPDDWLAPFHLAESYRALSRRDEAIREYRSCLARMEAGGPEPAPALLGGFAPEYFKRASTRQIERLEAGT